MQCCVSGSDFTAKKIRKGKSTKNQSIKLSFHLNLLIEFFQWKLKPLKDQDLKKIPVPVCQTIFQEEQDPDPHNLRQFPEPYNARALNAAIITVLFEPKLTKF